MTNTPSLRVRLTADIDDLKKGMAQIVNSLQSVQKAASKPMSGQTGFMQQLQRDADASGRSARELAMVMPQITDIVTSLQGGMPFTTVLLQQGGQLRDVFGSTSAALSAVGKGLLSMVTPATLAGAAIGGLVVAWKQAEDAQFSFEKALIQTGGYAGTSANQLQALADKLDAISGVTSGTARDAVLKVAQTGKFTGEQLKQVAMAAAALQEASVESIDATIAKFVEIQRDPVAALLKLNETEHFLTEAQIERISTLVEEGRQQQAVTEALSLYYDTSMDVADATRDAMPALTATWKSVKDEISEAWKNLGVYAELLAKVIAAQGKFKFSLGQATSNLSASSGSLLSLLPSGTMSNVGTLANALGKQWLRGKVADFSGVTATVSSTSTAPVVDSEAWRQQQAFQEETNRLLAAQLTLEERIKAMREKATEAGIAEEEILRREQAMRAADAKKTASKGNRSAISSGLQGYADAASVEKAQIEAQTKVLQTQYQTRTISASAYYTQLRQLTEQSTQVQATALEKQIAFLKEQKQTGEVTRQLGTLEAKLTTVRAEGTAKLATLDEQEKALAKQREDAIRTYKEGLDQQTQALQSEMDAMVAHVGAGDREYEIRQRIAQIYAKEAGELKRLSAARVQAGQDAEKLSAIDQQEADLRASTQEQVDTLVNGYQRLSEAQGNWTNGAKAAWANYLADVRDVAGAVQDALTSAFKGGEDAFVQFVKTGKLSFSSLADSIIEDMARIAYKQAMSGALSWMSSLFGGYSAPSASFASGFGNNTGWLFSGQLGGYALGGYTGDGGKFEPAGIVHKGEGVVPQWGIAAMGGPAAFMGFLGTLRGGRGYADGGVAGMAASAVSRSSSPNVQINIENNTGSQISAQAGDVKFDGEKWVIKIVANDIARGGAIVAAGKVRLGWKDQL